MDMNEMEQGTDEEFLRERAAGARSRTREILEETRVPESFRDFFR